MTQKVSLSLPYGRRNLEVELPKDNLLCVLSPKDLPCTPDEKEEIIRSLSYPIASSKIGKLAHECKSVVIASDDNTRDTPTRVIIPLILNELNKAKIRDDQIKIVVALGTHRPMTGDELVQKFGRRAARAAHEEAEKSMRVPKEPEKVIASNTQLEFLL